MAQEIHTHDCIIIGGGLVGLTQALLLAQNDFNIACIDKRSLDDFLSPQKNFRTTALSYASVQLYKALGVWNAIKPFACPIEKIDVKEGASSTLLSFNPQDDLKDKSAYGWVVENFILHAKIYDAITAHQNIEMHFDTTIADIQKNTDQVTITPHQGTKLSAPLLIGADGRQSFIREWMDIKTRHWSYHQQAVICIFTHTNPHHNQALEHFMADGPLAILPLTPDEKGNPRSTLIWTEEGDSSKRISFSDDSFRAALRAALPPSYGALISLSPRLLYPLSFHHAYDYIRPRCVIVGDAAHGLHPIAGQGLNMGLRDVATLCETLIAARQAHKDLGAIEVLENYQRIRRPDNTAMAFTTDSLNKIFSNKLKTLGVARKIGLKLMNKIKPAKQKIVAQTMGTSGHIPTIMRDKK